VSRDTALCIHAPQEQIKKNSWLSHYGLENKEDIALFFYATGAYHVNGKCECIRKIAYSSDIEYMALLHDDPVPPTFLGDARKTGADLVFCGRHLWFNVKKVSRLAPPWFGTEWATAYQYFEKLAEDGGLKVSHINPEPWPTPVSSDAAIIFSDPGPDTIDILIPCSFDTIPLRFWSSIITMDTTLISRILVSGDEDICSARNKLAKASVDGGAGRSIFFDVDMWFPRETVNKLAAHNKPIVGGVYHQRQTPFYPHVYENYGDENAPRSKRIINLQPHMKVDSIGTGCLMVAREVYQKIGDKPYVLRYVPIDVLIGEDINFCYQAKAHGYEIHADSTLDLIHIGTLNVNREEANKFASQWRPF